MPRNAVRTVVILLGVVLSPGTTFGFGARSFKSGPLQITADGAWVWAANQHHHSVSRLNTATNAVDEFPLPNVGTPHSPRGLSVREDGTQVWVACHDSDLVIVLDSNGSVIGQVALPWGSGPYSVALSRDQSMALVTLHRADALAVLDAGTLQLSIILNPVFHAPVGIVWLEDGTFRADIATARDPVCNRVIEVEGAPMIDSEGQKYYFCGHDCRKLFEGDPVRFRVTSGD